MTGMKILRVVFGLGIAAGVLATGVLRADTYDKRTVFTFNRPISLPGVTLPAGKYMFRLVDTETTRKVDAGAGAARQEAVRDAAHDSGHPP